MTATETSIHALATPALEPERSVTEVGRNRLQLLARFSTLLGEAPTQMWLVEQKPDALEFRLSYCWPSLSEKDRQAVRGTIVVEQTHGRAIDFTKAPDALVSSAAALFGSSSKKNATLSAFPINSPIPPVENDASAAMGGTASPPLAWVLSPNALVANDRNKHVCEALTFNLAILLERDRANRLSKAATQCIEILYGNLDLNVSLLTYAEKLIEDCGARFGGTIFYDGLNPVDIQFALPVVSAVAKREITEFIMAKRPILPAIQAYQSEIRNGREVHLGKATGNLLYVPITSMGFYLEEAPFTTLPKTGEIGAHCDFVDKAIFLAGKGNAGYLGNNFSETDKELCRRVARSIATAEFPKAMEDHFIAQARYFSNVLPKQQIDAAEALAQIKTFLPEATTLVPVSVFETSEGQVDVDTSDLAEPLDDALLDIVRRQTMPASVIRDDPNTATDPLLRYACHMVANDTPYLIFQAPTRPTPPQYYVVKLSTRIVERSRIQLLGHFVRELFQFHRAMDMVYERVSNLAQLRHVVINALGAATNNIDLVNRRLALEDRKGDSGTRLRDDKMARELITHASNLNHRALLYMDSSRFLISSLEYDKIKFDQYRPMELFRDVRLAFEHSFRQKQQQLNLKVAGNSSRSAVGDKDLLWIAMANLIDNASKYGHRGTEISVNLQFDTERWTFSVENSGDHLDEATAAELFRPFVRGRTTAPAFVRRQGTGLGLAVSRMIVKAHSSTSDIQFTSDPGTDNRSLTKFWFALPYRLAS